jgi:hypothetical protein
MKPITICEIFSFLPSLTHTRKKFRSDRISKVGFEILIKILSFETAV